VRVGVRPRLGLAPALSHAAAGPRCVGGRRAAVLMWVKGWDSLREVRRTGTRHVLAKSVPPTPIWPAQPVPVCTARGMTGMCAPPAQAACSHTHSLHPPAVVPGQLLARLRWIVGGVAGQLSGRAKGHGSYLATS